MRTPRVGKPRPTTAPISLSRKLPRLQLPTLPSGASRPRPNVSRPGKSMAGSLKK